jgi:HEAT repeat protein
VLWAVALALLLCLGALCRWVVVPVWRAGSAVKRCRHSPHYKRDPQKWSAAVAEEIAALGGPRRAAGKFALYIRLPDSLTSYRSTATDMLARCGERALPALVRLLKDEDPKVAAMAALGLGDLKDARAVPALLGAVQNSDPAVRRNAAWALGEIRDSRAIDSLISLLRDPAPEVRSHAASSIGEMAPRAGRALPPLMTLLGDVDARALLAAYDNIVLFGKAATPHLAAKLNSRTATGMDRRLALSLLADLGPDARAAVPVLVSLAVAPGTDHTLRYRAMRALHLTGHDLSGVLQALEKLLTHPDPNVSRSAQRCIAGADCKWILTMCGTNPPRKRRTRPDAP